MAKRLSVKGRKARRDKARAYKTGTAPAKHTISVSKTVTSAKHKVAVERSTKAKRKKAYVMT